MQDPTTNCHVIATNIKDTLKGFLATLLDKLAAKQATIPTSMNPEQQAIFMALLAHYVQPILLAMPGSVRQCHEQLLAIKAWMDIINVKRNWHLLSDNLSPQEQSGEISSKLSETFHAFMGAAITLDGNTHFIVPVKMAGLMVPDPTAYQTMTLKVHTGEVFSWRDLIGQLIERGYVRFEDRLEPGGIRVRGEQIDVRHPLWASFVTITFYGRHIESIVEHDGRRSRTVPQLIIPPVAFPDTTVPLSNVASSLVIARPQFLTELQSARTIITDSLNPDLVFPWASAPANPSDLKKFTAVSVFYENLDRTQQFTAAHGVRQPRLCRSPLAKRAFTFTAGSTIVTTEAALLPETRDDKPLAYAEGLALLAQLTPGKPAVHSDHGVGIYEGLQTRTVNNETREYLLLRFTGGDTVSVPVAYAYKVSAYVGDAHPPLARLGGRGWIAVKKRAQKDAAAFAQELIKIAGARSKTPREPYYFDVDLEQELTRSFPYELTPDQFHAWEDIKEAMRREYPFDILVVGDVGFGKTELALRAARHAVANDKQVAVLAPTTLLVQQHADTFRQRLATLAPHIGVLSRFATAHEQGRIRERLKKGEVKIAIGTHALLSTATEWHNLGLVIIDEEQRFGVRHKEHFKKLRANLDVLALSATPIPRTLGMALSGLKQLAVINTAPPGRQSVVTRVSHINETILREALERELERDGQVYVVAPKVRSLHALAHDIQKIAPQARVAVAHGQIPAAALSKIIGEFDAGRIDVLVSSAIVENGLDLPNANTIIVTQATHFGLADLYQLRGRVGRRDKQGYAYFLYEHHELTTPERERLAALVEASHLGSGWTLAQRDLEIRGAGNLLGAEQSGIVNEIGVQMYLDLIREAYHNQDRDFTGRREVEIILPLNASIPPHYIADTAARVEIYQKLARLASPEALAREIRALVRRYGAAPQELQHLHALLLLQILASQLDITHIESRRITPSEETPFDRISIHGRTLPRVIKQLGPMGGWEVQQDHLIINVPSVDFAFVTELMLHLSDPPYALDAFYASMK